MNDLVFCCPRCLKISIAASVDEATAARCRQLEMVVDCRHCGQTSAIRMTDTMLSKSATNDGFMSDSGSSCRR